MKLAFLLFIANFFYLGQGCIPWPTRPTTMPPRPSTTTMPPGPTPTTMPPSSSPNPSPTCNCGEPHRAIRHNRIIGGQDTEVNEYPWQVKLVKDFCMSDGSCWLGGCGGSIISVNHVLTAAHCMFYRDRVTNRRVPLKNSEITVVTGMHDTTDSNKTVHNISGYENHPEYPTYGNYDITIITLSSPITFSRVASPVCLPASVTPQYTGQVATVTGWGNTVQHNYGEDKPPNYPSILQEVNVTVVSNEDCQSAYGGGQVNRYKRKHQIIVIHYLCPHLCRYSHDICAADSGKDSCQGDSGGPLFLPENGRYCAARYYCI